MLSGVTARLLRMRKRQVYLLAALVVLVAAACGGSETAPGPTASETGSRFGGAFADVEAYPVFASSEVVVGENRFLVGLLDSNDAPIGSAAIDMHIRFFDLSESETEPVFERDMEFIETIPGERGLYMTRATFDSAGRWGAEVSVEGEGIEETVNASFDVAEEGTTPDIGARAPASRTPTSDDVDDLSEITTDPDPAPELYELSIHEAVKSKRPFVVAFSTPKFCTSQVCGPTLDRVKDVARGRDDVDFIHVEIYKNLDDPSNLVPVKAVRQWGLPSEPWVFVVDAEGRVFSKYEGTVTQKELKQDLSKL